MISILVADDFGLWRAKVRHILRARPEWSIACEACDGQQAVQEAEALRPDIVLLDIGMPVLNGIEAAKKIRKRSPNSKVVFLTECTDPDVMDLTLQLGAVACLVKSRAARELLPAIEAALLKPQVSQRSRSWKVIAEEIAREEDSTKLTELVEELNQALMEQDIHGQPRTVSPND